MNHFEHLIFGADYNPDQWLAHPEVIDADFELMPKAGMNSVSIGIFAWKELEPEEGVYCFEWLDGIMDRLAGQGMKAVLATPSGARPYWMDRDHPEVLRVSDMGVRYHHGIRHNHCFTSPYYRKKVREINSRLAQRYQDHPALGMWHIGNEFHGECYCELCQEAFRDWLREKYHGDIQELNEQWWTYCWSRKYSGFEEIEAPSPRGEYLLHGMNLDWKRFVTAQTVSFIKNELEPIRRFTPEVPVTTNLMGRSEAIDQWKLAEILDVVSVDSYPEWCVSGKTHARVAQFAAFTFDINRSLKKDRPFYLMECTPSLVNWYDVNRIMKPGMNELAAMQAIAHGSESVQYFQWRGARGASEKLHGTVVGHSGKDSTRIFREVSALGEKLKKLDSVVGSITRSEAALIYDWENKWAIGDLMGLTKPLDYDEICEEHYAPLWENGVSTDIISMEHDFMEYRLIIAPMLYSVRPGVADRLKQYVSAGGVLVLTFCTAYVNENDLCFLGGFPGDGLMEVTGLEAEEIDALYPEESNEIVVLSEESGAASGSRYRCRSLCEVVNRNEACRSLAAYTQDFYKEKPAVTVHSYGKGQCYYFATRVETDFLRKFYHRRIEEVGISRNIAAPLPYGVTVQRRQKGTEVFDFILNFTEEEQRVKLNEAVAYMDVLEQEWIAEKDILLPAFGYRILSHLD